jgi:1,3-beta-glucan synthase
MYFTMFVIFLALLIGPIVAAKFIGKIKINLPMQLLQPTGQHNNDTSGMITGSRLNGAGGPAAVSGGTAAATSAGTAAASASTTGP